MVAIIVINSCNYQEWMTILRELGPSVPQEKLDQLVSVSFGLMSKESEKLGLPDFPIDNLPHAAKLLVILTFRLIDITEITKCFVFT